MHRRSLLTSFGAALLTAPIRARAETCLAPTPGMVAGPFPPSDFRPELGGQPNPGPWRPVAEHDLDLSRVGDRSARGQAVSVTVRVVDRSCRPTRGAHVELWQCDAEGYYNHRNETRVTAADLDPGFGYWAKGITGDDGTLTVRTIVPGAYPASSSWWRPPHLHWCVRAEGHPVLTTQSYFDGDVLIGIDDIRAKNDADRILNYRSGFDMGLDARGQEVARRVARTELVARFTQTTEEAPSGTVTLRLG